MISFKNGHYMAYDDNGKFIEVPSVEEICEAIKIRINYAE